MVLSVLRTIPGLFVALIVAFAQPAPAGAFELFGLKLFGGDDSESSDIVDPVNYSADLRLAGGDEALAERLRDGSLLVRRQEEPPSGAIGLIARARDDQANLLGILYEQAHYGATVHIEIAGRPVGDIDLADALGPVSGMIPVTISVEPGPPFQFGHIDLRDGGTAARAAAEQAGLVSGAPASSRKIGEAETAIVLEWQRAGHPWASIADRQVVADHASNTLDVTMVIRRGPTARLGEVRIEGAERVDREFLERQAQVPTGEPYHPDHLEQVRRNLGKLGALGSTSVRVADAPGPDGTVPVIVDVSERKRRTIGAGALYSSTEGATVQGFWQHRNLLGRSETLRVDASIGGFFEADKLDEYNGLFSVLYSVPGFWHPRNRLDLKATVLQEDPDPYNRRGAVFESRLTHDIDNHLSVSGGLTFDWARIDDAFGRNFYTLVSAPFIARYDIRDNELDATRGLLAQARVEPQVEISSTSFFVTTDAELRYYLSLDDSSRFVLAARGLVGTTAGANLVDIPAHRRFYAGGGGSVRGYDYLNVGPRVKGFGATGGLSRVEGSLEARLKVTETIGIVPFIDAGLVTTKTLFAGTDEFQIGVGLGVRYYTSVGPIRLDVAFPLNPRSGDPDFAVYAGIGQAF